MMSELYLHPHIASTIKDESQKYVTAQGLTNLFACIFAAKGIDSTLVTCDSFTEYRDKFGDVYSSMYGQQPLNIKQWLDAGGTASLIRLLPEDATYAHAILDFQIRRITSLYYEVNGQRVTRQVDPETGKAEMVLPNGTIVLTEQEVIDAGGKIATQDRTLIRPRVKQVPGGARTTTAIAEYMEKLTGSRGEDGYVHYPIGAFIPNGRGQGYYNTLRASFNLNTTVENTYASRIYNLQFLTEGEQNTFSSADPSAPFAVSFDPVAVDKSDESQYIQNVLQRYAKEISWLANEAAWNELCEQINPDVDPGALDLLFLKEKESMGVYTSYHDNDVLSSGITYLTEGIAVGTTTTKIVVAEPKLLAVDCEVIIGGLYKADVEKINLTTGEITLKAPGITIVGEAVEDQTPISQVPDEEYRQTRVETAMDGSTISELTVLQVEDNNGVRIVNNGEASLMLDGVVYATVTITEVLEKTKVIKLAAPVTLPAAGGGTLLSLRQYSTLKSDGGQYIDFDNYIEFGGGSDGRLRKKDGNLDATVRNELLIKGYTGQITDEVFDKEKWKFDVCLDANYDRTVKDALDKLVSVIRMDFVALLDVGFTGNPEQAIAMRQKLGYSNFYTSLFCQDAYIQDESEGRWAKVTPTYFLAQKIPLVDKTHGLHWPFVGPRRGVITGFDKLSWAPNAPMQERLYRAQLNYIRVTQKRTMLYGQLTSQTVMSALSDLNHVRTLLRIQREVEELFEDYPFEFINDETLRAMNYALQEYMKKWLDNGALQSYTSSVYSSDYDRKSKIARVRIEYYFTAVLERIFITHVVKG